MAPHRNLLLAPQSSGPYRRACLGDAYLLPPKAGQSNTGGIVGRQQQSTQEEELG